MNIDKDTEFGSLEPLMLEICQHIKTDPDPKTNGSRYNKVWDSIYRFLQGAKNTEQQLQPDNLPEDGDSDYWDDHATGK